jgi:hypothetical protein
VVDRSCFDKKNRHHQCAIDQCRSIQETGTPSPNKN